MKKIIFIFIILLVNPFFCSSEETVHKTQGVSVLEERTEVLPGIWHIDMIYPPRNYVEFGLTTTPSFSILVINHTPAEITIKLETNFLTSPRYYVLQPNGHKKETFTLTNLGEEIVGFYKITMYPAYQVDGGSYAEIFIEWPARE